MNNYLIKNARIIDPLQKMDFIGDLLIKNGKVAAIDNKLSAEVPEIDASGKILTPGFVEIHAHLREPGQTHKEDMDSGAQAALAGGYTTVCMMPNTQPVIDNEDIVKYLQQRGSKINGPKFEIIAAVTKGLAGEELTDMRKLKELGVVAFSDDGRPIMNAKVMNNALEYAKPLNLPLLLHEEDLTLSANGAINAGSVADKLGLKGVPGLSEEIMIARDILLAERLDTPIHICHVSTAKSVELIREAQKNGIKVTCEVSPHHLLLTDEEFLTRPYDSYLKMSPPLRTEKDRLACLAAIQDDVSIAIATDHAPHSVKEKQAEFTNTPNGIIGLETAFPSLYTLLVRQGHLSLHQLIMKLTAGPAEALNLERGNLSPGMPADLVIIDLDKEFVYNRKRIKSKSENSPFLDRAFYGEIQYTFVDGEIKYKAE